MLKKLKICFVLLMVFVLTVGSTSFAAINNIYAKNTYLLLEKNNLEAILKLLSNGELSKICNSNILKSEFEVYGENIPGDIGNLKLISNSEINREKNYEYAKVSLQNKENTEISMEAILKDSKLMINIPQIYEKYIGIDILKFNELFKKFDIDISEEETNALINKILNAENGKVLSDADEKYLQNTFGKYILKANNLLDSKYFSLQKKAKLEYDNKQLTCNVATLKITADDIVNILNELWSDAKKDEKLLTIVFNALATSSDMENITKEEFIESIDEIFETLIDESENLKNIEFSSNLYYSSKNVILKREFKVDSNSENQNTYSFTAICNNKNCFYEIANNKFLIQDKVSKTAKKDEHKIKVTTKSSDYAFDENDNLTEVPSYEEKNYNILVEKLSSKEQKITLTSKDVEEKIVINLYNEIQNNKIISKLQGVLSINNIDYKIFLNCTIEKLSKITERSFYNNEFNLTTTSKEEIINEYELNKEKVNDKFEEIMEKLFFKTFNGKYLRYDKVTASQIGKATMIWEIDRMLDIGFSQSIPNYWVEYSSLEGLDDYISINNNPMSLKNSKYYVCKTNSGNIAIGISNNNAIDLPNPMQITEIDFDGTKSGIAYILGN